MDISVIIPVYNAEKFVSKAVESELQFPEVKEEAEKHYRDFFQSEITTVKSLLAFI